MILPKMHHQTLFRTIPVESLPMRLSGQCMKIKLSKSSLSRVYISVRVVSHHKHLSHRNSTCLSVSEWCMAARKEGATA